MAISDTKKLDIVWKKLFGVAETDILNKDVLNETIYTNVISYGHEIWTDSGKIPSTPPISNTREIGLYKDDTIAKMVVDETVPGNRTWLAVDNSNVRLRDWIPPSLGYSYAVRIYVENLDYGTHRKIINPTLLTMEYVFDYNAGVLYFPNCVPSDVLSNNAVLYIEGYRYIGPKGVGDGGGPIEPPKPVGDLVYELSGSIFGSAKPDEVVMRFVVAAPIRIDRNFPKSQAYCTIKPKRDTELLITRNDSIFGKIVFRANGDGYGEYRGIETLLFPKDILLVKAPSDYDNTMRDVEWTIVAQPAG
jgi:hypothetical protein